MSKSKMTHKIFLSTLLLMMVSSTFSQAWTDNSLELTSPGTSYTKTQLAEHTWSGSHALLFNAYKSISANGGLITTGNTKYANNIGAYSGGAGAIMFYGNGGRMDFLISPASTGVNTDVNWGTPKMTILRNGRIGLGTTDPDGNLSIVGNSTGQVKLHIANTGTQGYSVIRFSDSNQGSGKAYLHRFNAGWSSATPMWEANSIGFYESVGSMNIGGTSGMKVFTGSTSQERLRIESDGDVGIGTTSPNGRLHVEGGSSSYPNNKVLRLVANGESGSFRDHLIIESSLSSGYGIAFAGGGHHRAGIYAENVGGTSSTGQITMWARNNGNILLDGGNVGIGTTNPDEKLTVNGAIHSTEVKVDLSVPGPDYVFEPDYELRTLKETEHYIQENKHLPEIPSAKEMEENGLQLGEMNMLLLKKIEELTLYQIQLLKKIEKLEKKVSDD